MCANVLSSKEGESDAIVICKFSWFSWQNGYMSRRYLSGEKRNLKRDNINNGISKTKLTNIGRLAGHFSPQIIYQLCMLMSSPL
jgi:hypothetical protein